MAEEDIESTSTTSSSFDDEDEDTDEDEQQQIAQLLQRPARVQQQQNNQQQLDDNDDRILVRTMLETLGFEKRYIDKAIRVYEKSYGRDNYNPDDITQIILRLQEKEEIRKQKQQLLAMNLEPKLAEEIFGKSKYHFGKSKSKSKSSKIKSKSKMKSKIKSKTFGYYSGDIVIYKNKIKAQILDKFDDYLQISFPINKQIYQRAIIWIHYLNVKPKQSKSQQTNIKQKSSGIFSLFGSGNKTKWTGKHYNKYKYKYEKLCENVMVDQFKFESNDSIIGNDATY
eukprot:238034_1